MSPLVRFTILSMLSLGFVRHANAACSSPAAAIGSLDFQSGEPRYCDGTNWLSMASSASFPMLPLAGSTSAPVYTFTGGATGFYRPGVSQIAFTNAGTMSLSIFSGNVGVGTIALNQELEVAGDIRVGADAASCDAAKAGTVRYTSGKLELCDGLSWKTIQSSASSIGSIAFTSAGSNSWTVPANVTSVSVVAIGGGGGGAQNGSGNSGGGGGGALCYSNDYAVTPGASIAVIVGAGGNLGTAGGTSSFNSNVSAGGGGAGVTTSGGAGGTGTTVGGACSNGGAGGSFVGSGANFGAGGGGAAGYSGNGGQGGNSSGNSTPSNQTAGSGGGGGGGGGSSSPTDTGNGSGAGGGGVGFNGVGSSGAAGGSSVGGAGQNQTAGEGGSGGHIGGTSQVSDGNGGTCGGGGGGRNTVSGSTGGRGGTGCVRIIWGAGRSFPNNAN